MGHWKCVCLSQAGKKQRWPSNQGLCLATRVRDSPCWNCLEWLTNRQRGKEDFPWILSSWVSQAKRRREISRDPKSLGEAGQTQSQHEWRCHRPKLEKTSCLFLGVLSKKKKKKEGATATRRKQTSQRGHNRRRVSTSSALCLQGHIQHDHVRC